MNDTVEVMTEAEEFKRLFAYERNILCLTEKEMPPRAEVEWKMPSGVRNLNL